MYAKFLPAGFCLLHSRTQYLVVVSTLLIALLSLGLYSVILPENVIRILKNKEIKLVEKEMENRWDYLENDPEIPVIEHYIDQEATKREIVRYFEDVLFPILRTRREILGKDGNFTQAGEALYRIFDDSEKITKLAVQNFSTQRPVSIPHVVFIENQVFPDSFDLLGRFFLMALAEGSDVPDALVSAINRVPTPLSENNGAPTQTSQFLGRKSVPHAPSSWESLSYDSIFNGECVDSYQQSEQCSDGNQVPFYSADRYQNGDPDRVPSTNSSNGGGAYSRLDGHPLLGGVLVGRLPEDDSRVEISGIEWSDEDGKIRLSLQLSNEQSVGIGLFSKEMINLVLKFVADGRLALVTIIPHKSSSGRKEQKVLLHPILENTLLGCKVIFLDRLVDTLYENRLHLEPISGMNLVSQVRVEPYTLDDEFRFIYGPENSDVNPTWPFYFTLYYLKQPSKPSMEYNNFINDAKAAREHSPNMRKEVTGVIHQSLRDNDIDENLFPDLRQFVVLQRVFRLALFGYFGNGFPVEQLIDLAQYTEGSVEHVKTSTGQPDTIDKCPYYFSEKI